MGSGLFVALDPRHALHYLEARHSPTQHERKIMADNRTQIDPRYLKYNKDEVEKILDEATIAGLASEADVRAIVSGSHS